MDATLIKFEVRLKALEAQLEAMPQFKQWRELQAAKDKHIRHMQEMQKLLGGEELPEGGTLAPSVPAQVQHEEEGGMASRSTTPVQVIINVARKILEENGCPMKVAPLHEELKKRGITVGGNDPKANLSTKLWSAKGRVYNTPSGWWLPERKDELNRKNEGLSNGLLRP